MSKKKNTLKDLDEFLKQQAATLVAPTQLSETIEASSNRREEDALEISESGILNDIKSLAEKEGTSFRKKFYDIIIQSMEAQSNSLPEDKMLINTALYLKSGDKWKEAIKQYWKSRNY